MPNLLENNAVAAADRTYIANVTVFFFENYNYVFMW